MSRSRGWVFTINNYTDEDVELCNTVHCKYIVYGYEVSESGTPHLQGYVYFASQRPMKTVSKAFPRARLAVAGGSAEQNFDYCQKEGSKYVERGERPVQGKRSDVDSLVSFIKEGKTREEVNEAFPKLYFLHKKKIDEMLPKVTPKKKRVIVPIEEEFKYLTFNEDSSVFFDSNELETYEGEKIYVTSFELFQYDRRMEPWLHGFPPKLRRGYQVISFDPDAIFVTYKGEDQLKALRKKYRRYIVDACTFFEDKPQEESPSSEAEI